MSNVVRLAKLARGSDNDFVLSSESLTCFFKVSTRECIIRRGPEIDVAHQIAEQIMSAVYSDSDVKIIYEGGTYERI